VASGTGRACTLGQCRLSVEPRNFLDDDRFTPAAVDALHGVQQKNQKTPERNELEAAFGEMIVSGSRLMATSTNRP
jgi:hypothetical protein